MATGARLRVAGWKRPSRRPSGPGKMTAGIVDLMNLLAGPACHPRKEMHGEGLGMELTAI
ncbi:hypothetical protein NUTIK01_14990 [Novosphingobium sp. IK01]|uniref:Uncharacterized protein n=1 Tax=Novosphingobium pituita TaxID=3056842 RepID=A0ABQ6P649_9SPHN|nr:hypothetical protein NUTIK01_14990 [Novosphingobium sp. IK01]